MIKRILYKKGAALYMVIASILIALVFSGIILNLVLSQGRFSLHSASRLQAYYAALAGANYASEMFRTGAWSTSSSQVHAMCQSVTTPPAGCPTCDIEEPNLPNTIPCVDIVIDGTTHPSGALRIRTTADFAPPA
jgi:hypothetical protein